MVDILKTLVKDTIQIHLGPDSEIPEGYVKCDAARVVNGRYVPNLTNRYIFINNNVDGLTFGNSDNQPPPSVSYNVSGNGGHYHKATNNFNLNVNLGGSHSHNGLARGNATRYFSLRVTAGIDDLYTGFGNLNLNTVYTSNANYTWTSIANNITQNSSDGAHNHNYLSKTSGNSASNNHNHNIDGAKQNYTRPASREVCFIMWVGI